MELIEIIKTFADSSIALILALVVIYWNRSDMKEYAAKERDDKLVLLKALQENTAVLNELKILVQRLNGRKK